MQSILVNDKITKDKILSASFLKDETDINEFIIFADNILEGITVLNYLTLDDDFLKFYGVVYKPIDQPVYIYQDKNKKFYAIKICGSYEKWNLPEQVARIISYVDLPDYIVYSLKLQSVIIAGENTETASVGNSQWQREGRKLGAARVKVPFIYQTFYSGRDESQNTIREPSSLQVYNHLIYSIRYKTPSFVCYLENNFENSSTRVRSEENGQKLLCDYIKACILNSADASYIRLKKAIEFKFYKHMLSYLKEKKFTDLQDTQSKDRLFKDLPCINGKLYDDLFTNEDGFINNLIDYLYEEEDEIKIEEYLNNCLLLNFDKSKFKTWTSYKNKPNIRELLNYLFANSNYPKTYTDRNSKVGFADVKLCKSFLETKFSDKATEIDKILDVKKYSDVLLLPLRIYKTSNNKLTFSPDPESGEIVAFSELFSLDLKCSKIRPVIGYCIVDTPENFSIYDKDGTKLYKAIAKYVDILILNNKEIVFNLQCNKIFENYIPESINAIKPKTTTEEMAVVSTYLNLSTINSDWKLCFIHTHHSSWQQLIINNVQQKIDRVSTKVDLIMQQSNLFMICEGKNDFYDIIRDGKIKTAMYLASNKINELYKRENLQFDTFVYNLSTVPEKDPDFYVSREQETVTSAIKKGHFSDIAYHDSFVVIIVYLTERNETGFKLVYSPKFDNNLKKMLDREFNQ